MFAIIMMIVGIALVIFGAVVLLKFPNRPGGKIVLGGIETSSMGAGLPLIVLGVICIVISNTDISTKWDFWNEEFLGTAGDTALQRDKSGVTTHHLYKEKAVMCCGSITNPVNSFQGCVYSRIKAYGVISAVAIVVYRPGYAHDADATLLG